MFSGVQKETSGIKWVEKKCTAGTIYFLKFSETTITLTMIEIKDIHGKR